MARFLAPKGATSVTWNGIEYLVKKGILDAPEGAAEDLRGHGFVTEAEATTAAKAPDADELVKAYSDGYEAGKAEAEAEALKAAASVADDNAKALEDAKAAAKAEGKAEAEAAAAKSGK